MDVLVVVDMQPRFPAATDRQTINNVISLCNEAIKKNDPIVLLEYGSAIGQHHCHTDANILHHVYDYSQCQIIRKWKNDGSPEVLAACRSLKCSQDSFVVCGVNARACVKQTVLGLHRRRPYAKIKVVTTACNCRVTKPKDVDMFSWANEIGNVVLAK